MLQRVVAAAALTYGAVGHIQVATRILLLTPEVLEIGLGLLLLLGLWTPFVGVLVAVRELWVLFAGERDPWMSLMLATLGATLAMIGPGAWSIDARLFGRRQISRLR